MNTYIAFFIVFVCLLNILRIGFYLISSDVYSLKEARRRAESPHLHWPTISVLVPAHNEEKVIERCLLSLYNSCYRPELFEVIVVNDGSSDRTAEIVRQFQASHKDR